MHIEVHIYLRAAWRERGDPKHLSGSLGVRCGEDGRMHVDEPLLGVQMYLSIHLYTHIYVCISIYLSIYLYLYLSIYLSIYQYLSISIYLSNYVYMYIHIYVLYIYI